MRIVAYTRVSGITQADGDGPDRQREAVEKFCTKHGLEMVRRNPEQATFFEAVSGRKDSANRPVFSEMLEFIVASRVPGQEPITGIVVERMDRLARDLIVSELLLMECQKLGLSVFSADLDNLENLAGSDTDPMRVFVRQVMAAAAQLDRAMTVKKLFLAKQRILAKGIKCGGADVYGEKPGELAVITAMRSYRAQGWSYHVIAHQLNLGDIKPRRGKRWHPYAVKRILDRYGKEAPMGGRA